MSYIDLQWRTSKQAGKSSPLEFKITNKRPKKVTINIQREQASNSSTQYLLLIISTWEDQLGAAPGTAVRRTRPPLGKPLPGPR